MANVKISDLTPLGTDAASDDLLEITDVSGPDVSRSATVAQIIAGAAFPSGTSMLFQQTSAPTGWTKQTAHNNKAIRLQTGTVATGGADGFTTVFGTGKATASHTLTTVEMPAHNHQQRKFTAGANRDVPVGSDTATITPASEGPTTANTGTGGGHTHNLTNLNLQFVDFIIANKD